MLASIANIGLGSLPLEYLEQQVTIQDVNDYSTSVNVLLSFKKTTYHCDMFSSHFGLNQIFKKKQFHNESQSLQSGTKMRTNEISLWPLDID